MEQHDIPKVSSAYLERLRRYENTVALQPTDRVLVAPFVCALPVTMYTDAGKTLQDALEDRSSVYDLYYRFHREFEPDLGFGPGSLILSKPMGALGTDYVRFPGRDFTDPNKYFQILDKEYMTRDEYPEYILDPTGFMMRKMLPRHHRNLAGLSMIDLSNPLYMGALYNMIPFALPPVQEAVKTMGDVGAMMLKTAQEDGAFNASMMEMGFPMGLDMSFSSPFDVFNDFLRGIGNISRDMARCPDLLEEALDVSTKITLRSIREAYAGPHPPKTITFFLHNGMDDWMSVKNFERFFWPGLLECTKLIASLGGIPRLYFEGNIEKKLDIIADTLPSGIAIVNLIATDLKLAKEKLGKICCLSGGVDGSLISYGTPEEVERNVKSVLDIMAPGGGYYLDTDVNLDFGKPENVAMLYKSAREYGTY